MLSLTCRISKDCAHTAGRELTQRHAHYARRLSDVIGANEEVPVPVPLGGLSAIYRSFVNDPRARLCTDSKDSIASFSPPLVSSSKEHVVCHHSFDACRRCRSRVILQSETSRRISVFSRRFAIVNNIRERKKKPELSYSLAIFFKGPRHQNLFAGIFMKTDP